MSWFSVFHYLGFDASKHQGGRKTKEIAGVLNL